MSKVARAVGLLVAIVGAAIALSACGTASTPTPTPTATPDGPLTAEGILDRLKQAAAGVTSIRSVTDVTDVTHEPPEGWDSDDVIPLFNRMEVARTLEGSEFVFHLWGGQTAESVTVDNRQFDRMNDELWRQTVSWRPEGWPERTNVLPILPMVNTTLVGETEVQGVAVYHLQGERSLPSSGDRPPLRTVTIDLYVGKHDFLPHRAEERTHIHISNENGTGEISWRSITTHRDFNVPMAFERPTDVEDVSLPEDTLRFPALTHIMTYDTDRTLSDDEWADLIDALESHLSDLGGEGIVVEQDGSRGLTIETAARGVTVATVYDRVRERAAELEVELALVGVTRR